MQTLDYLLKLGERTLAHQQANALAAEAAEWAQKEQQKAELIEQAMSKAKEFLGEALLLDLLEGKEVGVDPFYNPPCVTIRLKFNLSLWVYGNETKLRYPPPQINYLNFPNSDSALALFIVEGKQQFEGFQAQALAEREYKVERAIEYILAGGRSNYDHCESPKEILEGWNFLETKAPDLWQKLNAAYQTYLKQQAEQQATEAAAEAHQAEVQSKVFYPFIVWRLTYVAREDEGEQEICTEAAFSLQPEHDGNGWWPIVRHGKVTPTTYPALLKIEQIEVTDWDTQVASFVCAKETIDGALVKVPPAGVAVLE